MLFFMHPITRWPTLSIIYSLSRLRQRLVQPQANLCPMGKPVSKSKEERENRAGQCPPHNKILSKGTIKIEGNKIG